MDEFTLRESTEGDRDFVNNLTRRVMSAYVGATWSKSEDREYYYRLNRFNQSTTRIIRCMDEDIGRLSVVYATDRILLEGIHIVEAFQGKGIGGQLLKQIIHEAGERQLPLELVLLKANPARTLYERTGFHVYKEDATRFYMRRAVQKQPGTG